MKFEEPSILEQQLQNLSVEQALDRAISAHLRIMGAKLELELIVKAHYYHLSNTWMNINKYHKSSEEYEYKHLRVKLDCFRNFNIDLLKK